MLGTGDYDPQVADAIGGAPKYSRSLSEVSGKASPSEIITFTERWDNNGNRRIGQANYHTTAAGVSNYSRFNASHGKDRTANVAFVDGHVALYYVLNTLTPNMWRW